MIGVNLFENPNSSSFYNPPILSTSISENIFIEKVLPYDILKIKELKNNKDFTKLNLFDINDKIEVEIKNNNTNNNDFNELNDNTLNHSFQSINNLNHKRKRKEDKDNIRRKYITHYLKFISDLINKIIRFIFKDIKYRKKIQFLEFRYNFRARYINKNVFDVLKKLTIKELFTKYISTKKKQMINEKILNYIIQKSNTIKNILNETCFNHEFVFLYYHGIKKIDLTKYNRTNLVLSLNSGVRFFQDFLNKNEDKLYIQKIKKYFEEEFGISKIKFNINKYI
jgi:hypothetical protein